MFINIITIISVVIGKIVLAQGEPVPTVSAKNTSSGENDNQFSTCLDILKRNPSVRNGWFRIKPKSEYENSEYALGFEVWCDFYSNETCIYPQLPDDSSLSKPIDVSTVPGEVWIANLGKEISYPFDNSQITILQKTSRTCHQNITVNCKNLVAFYDETLNTFDKSIKTLAWNGIQLTPLGPLDLKLRSDKDDCRYRDNPNEWKETIIEYTTDRCDRLPFTDVAIRDVWRGHGRGHGQWFYVKVGPVCFSWSRDISMYE